jgi:hypothetical protein
MQNEFDFSNEFYKEPENIPTLSELAHQKNDERSDEERFSYLIIKKEKTPTKKDMVISDEIQVENHEAIKALHDIIMTKNTYYTVLWASESGHFDVIKILYDDIMTDCIKWIKDFASQINRVGIQNRLVDIMKNELIEWVGDITTGIGKPEVVDILKSISHDNKYFL